MVCTKPRPNPPETILRPIWCRTGSVKVFIERHTDQTETNPRLYLALVWFWLGVSLVPQILGRFMLNCELLFQDNRGLLKFNNGVLILHCYNNEFHCREGFHNNRLQQSKISIESPLLQ
jgi:hypothetical protein